MDEHPKVSSKNTFARWLHYFYKDYPAKTELKKLEKGGPHYPCVHGPGYHAGYTLAGFIVAWLSRHVMEGPPQDGFNTPLFRLTVILENGRSVALGPFFLGTLYRRLDMLQHNMTKLFGRYEVSTYLSTYFLEMFVFEWFQSVRLS